MFMFMNSAKGAVSEVTCTSQMPLREALKKHKLEAIQWCTIVTYSTKITSCLKCNDYSMLGNHASQGKQKGLGGFDIFQKM